MIIISVEFDLPLPNAFLIDHAQTEGKTRKFTYHGPDKIYLQISKETGEEVAGPLTEEDRSDGRPIPEDAYLYEVDCIQNPLVGQLKAPVINELQEDYVDVDIFHPGSPSIDGYERLSYQLPLMPSDIFIAKSLRIVNNEIVFDTWTVQQKLLDRDDWLTWDDIRQHRNQLLAGSDSSIAEDMPDALKTEWLIYRQRLRDLPTVMQAHNVEPSIAYYMFPYQPNVAA
jgi:hypothetical protein